MKNTTELIKKGENKDSTEEKEEEKKTPEQIGGKKLLSKSIKTDFGQKSSKVETLLWLKNNILSKLTKNEIFIFVLIGIFRHFIIFMIFRVAVKFSDSLRYCF